MVEGKKDVIIVVSPGIPLRERHEKSDEENNE